MILFTVPIKVIFDIQEKGTEFLNNFFKNKSDSGGEIANICRNKIT